LVRESPTVLHYFLSFLLTKNELDFLSLPESLGFFGDFADIRVIDFYAQLDN
jgi:hypothetical protein